MTETEISKRMRRRAETAAPLLAQKLRKLADDCDAKAAGFFSEPQTVTVQSFVGSIARAKLFLREHFGESLI